MIGKQAFQMHRVQFAETIVHKQLKQKEILEALSARRKRLAKTKIDKRA